MRVEKLPLVYFDRVFKAVLISRIDWQTPDSLGALVTSHRQVTGCRRQGKLPELANRQHAASLLSRAIAEPASLFLSQFANKRSVVPSPPASLRCDLMLGQDDGRIGTPDSARYRTADGVTAVSAIPFSATGALPTAKGVC